MHTSFATLSLQCVLSAAGASRQVRVATRKRIMLELRHAICNLLLQCVLSAAGASRQVCVATPKRIMLQLHTSFAALSLQCIFYTTGASRQVCIATRKTIMPELRHAICNLIIAVCVVYLRCKSPGVCDERGSCWELHTSFAGLSSQSVVCHRCKSPGVCGDPKEDHAGVATRHLPPYYCSVCCLPQVQVARCV